jgi:hypothetical protein
MGQVSSFDNGLVVKDGLVFQGPDGKWVIAHINPNGQHSGYALPDSGDLSDAQNHPVKFDVEPALDAPTNDPLPSEDHDPGGDSKLTPGAVQDEPPVPGGKDTPGKGSTKVDTKAMKTFAANIQSLVDDGSPLLQIRDNMDTVNVKPGMFKSAADLKSKIQSDGGIRDQVRESLKNTIDALTHISMAVSGMASEYDSVEDANKMAGDKLNDYMSKVNTDISTLSH